MNISAPSLVTVAILISPSVFAHHSHSNLNRDDIQQHTGVVTKFSWRMPHVFLQVEGPNRNGDPVTWSIEMMAPTSMVGMGWDRDSFKPGDRVTWEGARDKDPDRYFTGMLWVEKSDGSRLYGRRGNQTAAPPLPVPSKDLTGLWIRDSRVGFFYAPPEDWPYNDAGKAMVARFDETQNPQFDCENPGPPKSTFLPYPMQISRPEEGTIVLDYELRNQQRVFKLGQPVVPGPPSKIGQSKAWMEGDELVVETSNFIADRWGGHTGVDSSAQKHLIERFSLIEGGLTLRIIVTLTDPVYLAEPVVVDYYMKKLPHRELLEPGCTLENARLFIEAGYDKSEDRK